MSLSSSKTISSIFKDEIFTVVVVGHAVLGSYRSLLSSLWSVL